MRVIEQNVLTADSSNQPAADNSNNPSTQRNTVDPFANASFSGTSVDVAQTAGDDNPFTSDQPTTTQGQESFVSIVVDSTETEKLLTGALGKAKIDKLLALDSNTVQTDITAGFIAAMPPEDFRNLPPSVLAKFSSQQIQAITGEQVEQLTGEQLQSLSPAQIAQIKPEHLIKLADEQWQVLLPDQIKALTAQQIIAVKLNQTALNLIDLANKEGTIAAAQITDDLKGKANQISAVDISKFTPEAIAALGKSIKDLKPEVFRALRKEQLEAISPIQAKVLTGDQIRAIGSNLTSLKANAIDAISVTQVIGDPYALELWRYAQKQQSARTGDTGAKIKAIEQEVLAKYSNTIKTTILPGALQIGNRGLFAATQFAYNNQPVVDNPFSPGQKLGGAQITRCNLFKTPAENAAFTEGFNTLGKNNALYIAHNERINTLLRGHSAAKTLADLPENVRRQIEPLVLKRHELAQTIQKDVNALRALLPDNIGNRLLQFNATGGVRDFSVTAVPADKVAAMNVELQRRIKAEVPSLPAAPTPTYRKPQPLED